MSLVKDVLILVLVEHTLREGKPSRTDRGRLVLILVLVEHTLRVLDKKIIAKVFVLILVLVEHTLRAMNFINFTPHAISLNPCFSGTYSQSISNSSDTKSNKVLILVLVEHTLRAQGFKSEPLEFKIVLILVLVEHTLREWQTTPFSFPQLVLILVLVEHTLREVVRGVTMTIYDGLNPCFSGTYSQSGVLNSILKATRKS